VAVGGAATVGGIAVAAGRIRRAVGPAVAGGIAVAAGATVAATDDGDGLGAGALLGLTNAASVGAPAGALADDTAVDCSPVCGAAG
jgi:hypothetical protein